MIDVYFLSILPEHTLLCPFYSSIVSIFIFLLLQYFNLFRFLISLISKTSCNTSSIMVLAGLPVVASLQ